ncbi:MAG: SigB/SigF/SigG family RNA polymerase sigma factor [Capsulimonadaceae bacterium]|nr:SigB/SigF/SigG family RNA polymerase sigma factor [Capsulimonadaceae bacterium]
MKHNSGTDGEPIERDAEKAFRRYAASHNERLRDQLVKMHQNLVRYLASKFVNRGEPFEDLVQVGTIGLINAIDRFDPDRGIKFSTYATPTVVGEIRRYFRDKAWSMKVPRRLQELNIAASKAQDSLSSRLGRAPTIREVAERIGATEEETLEAIELGNAYDTVSLDTQMSSDPDSSAMTLGEYVGAEDVTIQNLAAYGDLTQAIEHLEPRERMIIVYRFFRDMSQADVAANLNISQMHVSRLQSQALRTLKKLLVDEYQT